MLRLHPLEEAGAQVAAYSGTPEGDCGWEQPHRRAWLETLGLTEGQLVCVRQVHGAEVVVAREADAGRGGWRREDALGDADGLITDVPGLALGIHAADCIPVYLVDAATGAVGLLHAGRKGTFARIAEAGVRALAEAFGTDPAHLHAAIGPGAGPRSYVVDEATAGQWTAAGWPAQGRVLDLWGANREQLVAAGVAPERIHVAAICTISDHGYHSYRRDQNQARNLAVIMR